MSDRERDLHALRNLIDEAHLTLDTADGPTVGSSALASCYCPRFCC
jgi:hypothetical protein